MYKPRGVTWSRGISSETELAVIQSRGREHSSLCASILWGGSQTTLGLVMLAGVDVQPQSNRIREFRVAKGAAARGAGAFWGLQLDLAHIPPSFHLFLFLLRGTSSSDLWLRKQSSQLDSGQLGGNIWTIPRYRSAGAFVPVYSYGDSSLVSPACGSDPALRICRKHSFPKRSLEPLCKRSVPQRVKGSGGVSCPPFPCKALGPGKRLHSGWVMSGGTGTAVSSHPAATPGLGPGESEGGTCILGGRASLWLSPPCLCLSPVG